ncbi:hypothetical protein FE257_008525 [Aspergillus nanangensis]|uniref:RBR-type E3 ubiquitin transferase n=1 Tax=Aspergillus nanangensis TaxID=2582783 RepID=A0AAD4CLS6_ASPNN|nr:hypothetical protein FE257_008525 [Aspergillus nanangensis]
MEYDQDRELALTLLLENLDELADSQRGKQKSGRPTDLELSIIATKEELLAAYSFDRDRVLARSTATAIATDQNILIALAHNERVAEQDRHYAMSLSGNANASVAPDQAESLLFNIADDNAISSVMGDLMDRVNSDSGEGSSHTFQDFPISGLTVKCASCLEAFDADDCLTTSCVHSYCRDCTRQIFLGATKDEELYPPRCCGRIIPPGIAIRILDYSELRAFCERGMEYAAKDRLYCSSPTCSKFIPPFAINGELGTCHACEQQTHLPCRARAPPHVDCPLDAQLQEVLALAEVEGWRRCPHCRTMVELQHGCNHITCRCGREFCYVCGLVWKTCRCPVWHENRLIQMANQAVADEVPQHADEAVRQNAFNRIVENLQRHDDVGCQHHVSTQWVWRNSGSLECDICDDVLPEYIFMCTNCRMRACNRCRRHRLR